MVETFITFICGFSSGLAIALIAGGFKKTETHLHFNLDIDKLLEEVNNKTK